MAVTAAAVDVGGGTKEVHCNCEPSGGVPGGRAVVGGGGSGLGGGLGNGGRGGGGDGFGGGGNTKGEGGDGGGLGGLLVNSTRLSTEGADPASRSSSREAERVRLTRHSPLPNRQGGPQGAASATLLIPETGKHPPSEAAAGWKGRERA